MEPPKKNPEFRDKSSNFQKKPVVPCAPQKNHRARPGAAKGMPQLQVAIQHRGLQPFGHILHLAAHLPVGLSEISTGGWGTTIW